MAEISGTSEAATTSGVILARHLTGNDDRWPRDFCDGWRRLYPPLSTKGHIAQLIGEERLRRALFCVNETGVLWRRLPNPRAVTEAQFKAIGLAREQKARRQLLGVS